MCVLSKRWHRSVRERGRAWQQAGHAGPPSPFIAGGRDPAVPNSCLSQSRAGGRRARPSDSMPVCGGRTLGRFLCAADPWKDRVVCVEAGAQRGAVHWAPRPDAEALGWSPRPWGVYGGPLPVSVKRRLCPKVSPRLLAVRLFHEEICSRKMVRQKRTTEVVLNVQPWPPSPLQDNHG